MSQNKLENLIETFLDYEATISERDDAAMDLARYVKQIRLIEKKIISFEGNKLDLFDLICDLTGLLNILETVPNSWKDDFQTEINTLELIYDGIEDGSIHNWSGNFKADVNESISTLKKMTTNILEEYLKNPDPNISETAIEALPNWWICPRCHDAWESHSHYAMLICPKCEEVFNNPTNKI